MADLDDGQFVALSGRRLPGTVTAVTGKGDLVGHQAVPMLAGTRGGRR